MSSGFRISATAAALASHPGLSIATALSLGLAIGAQTSVYCLIDALFLRPPAGVAEAQRLVLISALDRGVPTKTRSVIPTISITATTIRRSPSWPATSIQESHSRIRAGGGTACARCLSELFSALGVTLMSAVSFSLMRMSCPDETRRRSEHSFWQRRFDADPGVLVPS